MRIQWNMLCTTIGAFLQIQILCTCVWCISRIIFEANLGESKQKWRTQKVSLRRKEKQVARYVISFFGFTFSSHINVTLGNYITLQFLRYWSFYNINHKKIFDEVILCSYCLAYSNYQIVIILIYDLVKLAKS